MGSADFNIPKSRFFDEPGQYTHVKRIYAEARLVRISTYKHRSNDYNSRYEDSARRITAIVLLSMRGMGSFDFNPIPLPSEQLGHFICRNIVCISSDCLVHSRSNAPFALRTRGANAEVPRAAPHFLLSLQTISQRTIATKWSENAPRTRQSIHRRDLHH